MHYSDLKTELDLALYSAMTDEEAAAELNAVDKERNKTELTGSEIWSSTDSVEYGTLTDAEKASWLSFCGIELHDPFGVSSQFVIDLFGPGNTLTTLQELRVETVSRATILGFGLVLIGDVEYARTL